MFGFDHFAPNACLGRLFDFVACCLTRWCGLLQIEIEVSTHQCCAMFMQSSIVCLHMNSFVIMCYAIVPLGGLIT